MIPPIRMIPAHLRMLRRVKPRPKSGRRNLSGTSRSSVISARPSTPAPARTTMGDHPGEFYTYRPDS